MLTTIRVDANVPWQAFFDLKSNHWIGVCHGLNLNASGRTWGELMSIIDETQDLLFRSLLNSGELEGFLRKHGWKLTNQKLPSKADRIHFDIPALVERKSRYDQTALAA